MLCFVFLAFTGAGCGGSGGNNTCTAGQSCTPSGTADACKTYATTCDANGTSTCAVAGDKASGTACGTGQVCGGGTCNACVESQACASTTACRAATLVCSSGFPVCTDTGSALPDGTTCGGTNVCAAGVCQVPSCASVTVKVPPTGSPAWSADFSAWMNANGFAHLAANQGFGGGTGCPTSTRDPVILIHGNSGADDPTSNSFSALKAKLIAGGYTDCDIFAITWLEQNANTSLNHYKASYLKLIRDFMQAVQGYTGTTRVDVVSWSMGVTAARKAIQGGIAYEDTARTIGCNLGSSLSAGVDTFLGVAGVNRGMTMCANSTSAACSENGLRVDSAFLVDVNGGSGGTYSPAPIAAHVYSIVLPDDQFMCGSDPRGLGPFACEVFGVHSSHIPGEEFSRSYDLFNESYGNGMGLNFNCTADSRGKASNCDHILVFFDASSLDGMVKMIRDNTTTGLPAAPFSQADLTGDWDTVLGSTNDGAGWQVASLSVDGAGLVTFGSYGDSTGLTALPPAGALVLSVDANGVVTAPGASGNPSFHGKLNAQKNLVVGTQTGSTGAAYSLLVLRKRVTGVTYSAADVANLAFAFHQLETGGSTNWGRGTGSTDASGSITIASFTTPSGPGAVLPPGYDAFQISPTGLVTLASDTTFHGVMTADKKAIFGVRTQGGTPPSHVFAVLLVTGQSYVQANLAGAYEFHSLTSGAAASTSTWLYGRTSVDAAGSLFFQYAKVPSGPLLPASATFTLAADGTISSASSASYAGRMAFGKDFYVRTETVSGASNLSICVK